MSGPCDVDIAKRLGAAFGFAQFMQAIPALQNAGKRPLDDGRSETLAKRAAEFSAPCPTPPNCKPSQWALLSGYQAEWIIKQVIKTPERVIDGIGDPSPFLDRYLFMKARF